MSRLSEDMEREARFGVPSLDPTPIADATARAIAIRASDERRETLLAWLEACGVTIRYRATGAVQSQRTGRGSSAYFASQNARGRFILETNTATGWSRQVFKRREALLAELLNPVEGAIVAGSISKSAKRADWSRRVMLRLYGGAA